PLHTPTLFPYTTLFRSYVNQRGDNEIRQWLDSLPKPVRIKIDARIRILQTVEQLKYPYVEKWVGEDDLYEVRVVFGGTQYRSLRSEEHTSELQSRGHLV